MEASITPMKGPENNRDSQRNVNTLHVPESLQRKEVST